jgi:phage repressor protein C with HTH and peptisase S24 domain
MLTPMAKFPTNRIKAARESKSITLEQLDELTGISYSMLSRIEGGTRGLNLEDAVKIARALGSDVADLTDQFTTEDIEAAERTGVRSSRSRSAGDIPNLTIHAGMGGGGVEAIEGAEGGFVPAEYTNGYWTFPDPIRQRFHNIAKTHALPVLGDSMTPTLIDGSIVFVDTTHVVPSPPDLYAVDYGDGLMVKRIELIPKSRKVRVISDNNRYQTHELGRQDLHVFGRVIAWFQWRG